MTKQNGTQTYDMLVAACELKQVFLCLETSFPDYNIALSMDDWKQIEILCTYLKLFLDAVSILTAQTYLTACAFYHEVSKVQLELTHGSKCNDPFISNLTKPLKEKFDRYWGDCCLVLGIAVVMDPMFKMKLVEFSFSNSTFAAHMQSYITSTRKDASSLTKVTTTYFAPLLSFYKTIKRSANSQEKKRGKEYFAFLLKDNKHLDQELRAEKR
ncbi:hypothetical protein V6N13_076333 [Hibiscus sabdariffa]|uniref:Uncharacterized protein n=2 Tax=Hibiscus sabdariffa TaxID=183260 RepID=A0ABR2B0H4_9ROSI